MNNEIKVFNNKEFGSIRAVTINGEPWFVAKDLSEMLGYTQTNHLLRIVDKEDIQTIDPQSGDFSGFLQNGTTLFEPNPNVRILSIINESGMYAAIFGSTLPNAKKFKHWVTSEVLPSLRQNGGYVVGQEQMSPEEIVANALVVANKIIEQKEKRIKELEPKGKYFDALVEKRLLTTFRDTAKEFNIAPQKFTQWLLDKGYIYKDKHKMIKPVARFVKEGLFQMKDFMTPAGYANVQTYVTVKGKETFRLLLEIEDK